MGTVCRRLKGGVGLKLRFIAIVAALLAVMSAWPSPGIAAPAVPGSAQTPAENVDPKVFNAYELFPRKDIEIMNKFYADNVIVIRLYLWHPDGRMVPFIGRGSERIEIGGERGWYRSKPRVGDAEVNIPDADLVEFVETAASEGAIPVSFGAATPCSGFTQGQVRCEGKYVRLASLATENGVKSVQFFKNGFIGRGGWRATQDRFFINVRAAGGIARLATEDGTVSTNAQKEAQNGIRESMRQQILSPTQSETSGSTDGVLGSGSAVVPGCLRQQQDCGESDEAGPGDTGGIDFTSVDLRYLAEPPGADSIEYAFSAKEGPGGDALATATQQSDAFFTWLALPQDKFWVNLNPTEPDRIIDKQLGQTDVGRTLLEADLELKETSAKLVDPETELGKKYWELQGDAGGEGTCTRQWIVPKPASVYESEDGIYILEAPLGVNAEAEYRNLGGPPVPESCPDFDPATAELHKEAEELVVAEVEKVVNEAPEYADLRRVYLSRIAAEWYRQKSMESEDSMLYEPLIDSRDISRWTSDEPWQPKDVFDRYVESYNSKKFTYDVKTPEGTVRYLMGGVDFSTMDFDPVDAAEFEQDWADRASVIDDSLKGMTKDGDGTVWLGATVEPNPVPGLTAQSTDESEPEDADPTDTGAKVFYAVMVVVVTVAGLRGFRRLRQAETG